jgi:hypothetical protein
LLGVGTTRHAPFRRGIEPAVGSSKLDEGKSRKEALRALKRQIAKTVYRHLVTDAHR